MARRLRELGPGLVTGAADDDPSGIATYAQAGAAFGYGLLWTALLTLPLMAAVQSLCARIGVVTGGGLARALRRHAPRRVLWAVCGLLVVANTINIGADLSGMAAAALLVASDAARPAAGVADWRAHALVVGFALAIVGMLAVASYAAMARVFKWLALTLLTYVAAGVLAHPDWAQVLRGTLVPRLTLTQEAVLTVVAIFGTTISPYLFFWQAAQNAEEQDALRRRFRGRTRRATSRELGSATRDVLAGMTASNLVMYFIVLTTGATLHRNGVTTIATAEQAAAALRPVAGQAASWLFAAGLVGTGLLAVPVLAGSAAYAVGEALAWRRGLEETPRTAPAFYGVIAAAVGMGVAFNFAHVDPIRLLVWSAVLNGLLAPPVVALVVRVSTAPAVMGEHRARGWAVWLGWVAVAIMTAAALVLVGSWLWG